MVWMYLLHHDERRTTYAYRPEREDAPRGIVSLVDDRGRIDELAPDDELKWYAQHAIYGIRKMLEEGGDLPERTYRAWY